MSKFYRIGVLNGPNLNLLGTREPELYGKTTLAELEEQIRQSAKTKGAECFFRQSNIEGILVESIHELWQNGVQGLIFNPGAYAHTSIALLDALKAVQIPTIEVHLTNVYAREPFRHFSYTSAAALGVISGLGTLGYHYALDALIAKLK